MDCPFCNQENIKRQSIYETKSVYVLYNIRRSNKGRCLVVPKRHVVSIRDLTDREASNLIKTVKYVSKMLELYLKPDGFNYGFNEGWVAGQRVKHFHFHILPRTKSDFHPKLHVFHGDHRVMRSWSKNKYNSLVDEFRQLFQAKKLSPHH